MDETDGRTKEATEHLHDVRGMSLCFCHATYDTHTHTIHDCFIDLLAIVVGYMLENVGWVWENLWRDDWGKFGGFRGLQHLTEIMNKTMN